MVRKSVPKKKKGREISALKSYSLTQSEGRIISIRT
jgi:hypothetical protein